MSLEWTDLINDVSGVNVDDINKIAHAVQDDEKDISTAQNNLEKLNNNTKTLSGKIKINEDTIQSLEEVVVEKADKTDLDDKVSFSDYPDASGDKAGVVKVPNGKNPNVPSSRFGLIMGGEYIIIAPAPKDLISDREGFAPIVPENINYAVKATLSDDNRIDDMTDEEKTNARDVIGAVGFTDYPHLDDNLQEVPGVVRTHLTGESTNGIIIDNDGYIMVYQASEEKISARLGSAPITPDNLDYAVRSVKPYVFDYPEDDVMCMSPSVNWICDGCGTAPQVEVSMPTGSIGDFLQVDFYSGETPPTLTIQSTQGITDIDLIPEANTAYSLYFDFGLIAVTDGTPNYGWRFSYAAYPYNTEV